MKGERQEERKSFSAQSQFYPHHITQTIASTPPMTRMLPNLVVVLCHWLTLKVSPSTGFDTMLMPSSKYFLHQDITHSWFSFSIAGHFFLAFSSSSCTSPWPLNGGMPRAHTFILFSVYTQSLGSLSVIYPRDFKYHLLANNSQILFLPQTILLTYVSYSWVFNRLLKLGMFILEFLIQSWKISSSYGQLHITW